MAGKIREATIDWMDGENPLERMDRKFAEEKTIKPGEQCDGKHLCNNGFTCRSGLVLLGFSRESANCRTLVNEGDCPPHREMPRNSLRYKMSAIGAEAEAEDALKRFFEVYPSEKTS